MGWVVDCFEVVLMLCDCVYSNGQPSGHHHRRNRPQKEETRVVNLDAGARAGDTGEERQVGPPSPQA